MMQGATMAWVSWCSRARRRGKGPLDGCFENVLEVFDPARGSVSEGIVLSIYIQMLKRKRTKVNIPTQTFIQRKTHTYKTL
jgi:hypothetical protein